MKYLWCICQKVDKRLNYIYLLSFLSEQSISLVLGWYLNHPWGKYCRLGRNWELRKENIILLRLKWEGGVGWGMRDRKHCWTCNHNCWWNLRHHEWVWFMIKILYDLQPLTNFIGEKNHGAIKAFLFLYAVNAILDTRVSKCSPWFECDDIPNPELKKLSWSQLSDCVSFL